MISVDIGGHELDFDIPEDAVVTGAVGVITYQRLHDGQPAAGVQWSHSDITQVQAIGMVRLAQLHLEDLDDYDLEGDTP